MQEGIIEDKITNKQFLYGQHVKKPEHLDIEQNRQLLKYLSEVGNKHFKENQE
jgi:phosphoribosylaminoimidazole carboxylase (NCAIR synthetase)